MTYTLIKPKVIDFAAVEKASHGAGYTLKHVELEVTGTLIKKRCEVCEKEVPFLKLDHTGQLFEVSGDVAAGGHVDVRGTVTGWGRGHAVLKVVSATRTPTDSQPAARS